MSKKKVAINYTARDFNSIKEQLLDYTKRYYPETYQDFSEASFGSLMIDTVSYVGDMLSYFVDYQANESFLQTAYERENIIRLSRQLGYNYQDVSTATGEVFIYALIPANELGLGPDSNYMPIIKSGTTLSDQSDNGFILTEDIRFDDPANEVVVGRVNESTGLPTSYAVRASGKIISGQLEEIQLDIGDYEKFLKLEIPDTNVVEIISVVDLEGNEYYQVDNLTQDIIYKTFANDGENSDTVKEYLRPISAPRRFTFEYDGENYFLQFGHGSEETIEINQVADPSDVALQMHGRDYVADVQIDPTRLLQTDKMGVSPSSTTLTIVYRKNTNENTNAAAGSINNFSDLNITFKDILSLSSSKISSVRGSLEITNQNPIVGSSVSPTAEEIKIRAQAHFATQNRAVTEKDYESMIYSMPSKFGSISRCNIVIDSDAFKRNLNAYVLGTDKDNKLTRLNNTLKENLKIWISNYKMINDTVDIIDAKIVNLAIEFDVVSDPDFNSSEIYGKCISVLSEKYSKALQMGEPFYVTDVYFALNKISGVIDTKNVRIINKNSSRYSSTSYNIESNMSSDGRYLRCPTNVCFEIKYPNVDITGVIR